MDIAGIDLDFQHTWTYQMYEGMCMLLICIFASLIINLRISCASFCHDDNGCWNCIPRESTKQKEVLTWDVASAFKNFTVNGAWWQAWTQIKII